MFKNEFAPQLPYLPYKSLGVSLIFSLFFGPLGLLYSSIWGGVTMVLVAFVVLSSHYPIPVILMWVGCSVWAVAATNRYNRKLVEKWLELNNEEKNNAAPATH